MAFTADAVPVFASARAADVIMSDVRQSSITPDALRSVNILLDELLWLFLANARSLDTTRLKYAVTKTVPTQLGKDAILEAEVDLRAYLDKTSPNNGKALSPEPLPNFPLQAAFEFIRLKCQLLSSFGELEEDPVLEAQLLQNYIQASHAAPGSDATTELAPLYVAAVIEHICQHVLTNVARVVSRDSSRTTADVQDLFTSLCEDASFYSVFKTMKVQSHIQSHLKAGHSRSKGASSEETTTTHSSPSSRPSFSSAHHKTTSRARSVSSPRPSLESSRGVEGGTPRKSGERSRMMRIFRQGSVSGADSDDGGHTHSSSSQHNHPLPNGNGSLRKSSTGSASGQHTRSESVLSDATKRVLANFAGLSEDETGSRSGASGGERSVAEADFDELLGSGNTMKVSLTPDRLKSFEVYNKEKSGRTANRAVSALSQEHAASDGSPAKRKNSLTRRKFAPSSSSSSSKLNAIETDTSISAPPSSFAAPANPSSPKTMTPRTPVRESDIDEVDEDADPSSNANPMLPGSSSKGKQHYRHKSLAQFLAEEEPPWKDDPLPPTPSTPPAVKPVPPPIVNGQPQVVSALSSTGGVSSNPNGRATPPNTRPRAITLDANSLSTATAGGTSYSTYKGPVSPHQPNTVISSTAYAGTPNPPKAFSPSHSRSASTSSRVLPPPGLAGPVTSGVTSLASTSAVPTSASVPASVEAGASLSLKPSPSNPTSVSSILPPPGLGGPSFASASVSSSSTSLAPSVSALATNAGGAMPFKNQRKKQRGPARNRDSLDLDDIMNGSDEEEEEGAEADVSGEIAVPTPALESRTVSEGGGTSSGTAGNEVGAGTNERVVGAGGTIGGGRNRALSVGVPKAAAGVHISASAREFMDFLNEGPPMQDEDYGPPSAPSTSVTSNSLGAKPRSGRLLSMVHKLRRGPSNEKLGKPRPADSNANAAMGRTMSVTPAPSPSAPPLLRQHRSQHNIQAAAAAQRTPNAPSSWVAPTPPKPPRPPQIPPLDPVPSPASPSVPSPSSQSSQPTPTVDTHFARRFPSSPLSPSAPSLPHVPPQVSSSTSLVQQSPSPSQSYVASAASFLPSPVSIHSRSPPSPVRSPLPSPNPSTTGVRRKDSITRKPVPKLHPVETPPVISEAPSEGSGALSPSSSSPRPQRTPSPRGLVSGSSSTEKLTTGTKPVPNARSPLRKNTTDRKIVLAGGASADNIPTLTRYPIANGNEQGKSARPTPPTLIVPETASAVHGSPSISMAMSNSTSNSTSHSTSTSSSAYSSASPSLRAPTPSVLETASRGSSPVPSVSEPGSAGGLQPHIQNQSQSQSQTEMQERKKVKVPGAYPMAESPLTPTPTMVVPAPVSVSSDSSPLQTSDLKTDDDVRSRAMQLRKVLRDVKSVEEARGLVDAFLAQSGILSGDRDPAPRINGDTTNTNPNIATTTNTTNDVAKIDDVPFEHSRVVEALLGDA